jgi:membrane associated rhomboid family serine protease
MSPPAEKGKLFGLPIWQALLVFALASLVGMFTIVAMREGLGWPVPQAVGGGLGGLLGVIAVSVVARRKRKLTSETPRSDG